MRSVSTSVNRRLLHITVLLLLFLCAGVSGCYTFRDASVPASVKTFRLALIENRARYVNPQLAPQLTDRLRQKINSQFSRLRQVDGEDANYDIKAEIRGYDPITSGISGQQASINRLAVTVHIVFKNNTTEGTKSFEADVSRNFDFNASTSFESAQAALLPTILQNMSDEIFNRIFSNW
jgi:hypothetical protein